VLVLAAAGAFAAWTLTRSHHEASTPPATTEPPSREPPRAVTPVRLAESGLGELPEPLQDAAAAALPRGRMLLLGGLTAADTSTDAIVVASGAGARVVGRLPSPRHDAAAARLGGSVYVFGGGNGTAELDEIVRVDASSGTSTVVAHLPAASSDSAAAALGGSAYVVGGYTGSRWLDTIVAWRPGAPARVVARLPRPLRYASATAAAGRLVIAGGSLENGTASDAAYVFVPGSRKVTRIGRLPAPTTHAAAAATGGLAFVVGGRGAAAGSETARIASLDPRTGRVRNAGTLDAPRSDLAAAAAGGRILLAGGRSRGATLGSLDALVRVRDVSAASASVNVYAHDAAGMLAPTARRALPRVYVPNSESNTVDVIDPRTFTVVAHFAVGGLPQHVVPAWDLRTLYVTNDTGNSLTPIDPTTGKPGAQIQVDDPYNMYFTPDGRYAIVVAERLRRLDFRDAHTFRLHRSVPVPCVGVDHMDFSADGRYLLASCEFSGQMVKVDVARERVVGVLDLPDGRAGMPQDVKLSPDGRTFYVADMRANGLWKIDGDALEVTGFLPTGAGVHGLYPSRDARDLYATNRSEGSISVISFRTGKVVKKWWIPGGGSPDMGGVSADGKVLWLSGRYNAVVYAISTIDGRVLAKIPVGRGPHGLCVWPQPGRYSLGHTGVLR
jgi:YVTN family beta-propeller protein